MKDFAVHEAPPLSQYLRLSSDEDSIATSVATAPYSEETQRDGVDGGAFDLAGWEVEVEPPLPQGDPTIAEAARELQSAISKHQPIDTSTDWEDFEAYLPERASSLPGANDADARERLRLVLLRSIREGSVPDASIEELSLGDDGFPNAEACSLLRMVINDVGAETDERFEYCTSGESFEVVVAPEMTPEEENTVAEALAFIDNLAERRNDPLRIYQKEFQKATLLTANEEVTLGQEMERGVEQALDALASWPSGIRAVLDAVRLVKSEAKPLRWLSSGSRVEPQDVEIPPDADSVLSVDGIGTDDESDSQFGKDAQEATDELSELFVNAGVLSGLDFDGAPGSECWNARRKALDTYSALEDQDHFATPTSSPPSNHRDFGGLFFFTLAGFAALAGIWSTKCLAISIHDCNALSSLSPGLSTNKYPFIGLPVKSISRACRRDNED